MTTETQEAGTATTDAGGTQTAEAQTTAQQGTETTQEAKTPEADYEFKMPEGIDLDEDSANEFKAIAKELKLPKDAAQKVVDLAAKREQARADAFVKQVKDWGEAVKADKELGTPENLAACRKTIETFGTPELRTMLETSGMGNHPEVVRFVTAISKVLSEDKFIAGRDGGNAQPRSLEERLYGKTTPN